MPDGWRVAGLTILICWTISCAGAAPSGRRISDRIDAGADGQLVFDASSDSKSTTDGPLADATAALNCSELHGCFIACSDDEQCQKLKCFARATPLAAEIYTKLLLCTSEAIGSICQSECTGAPAPCQSCTKLACKEVVDVCEADQ